MSETSSYEMKVVDAAEWARIHAENADLRRQLAECEANESHIIDERDAAEKEAADLRAKYADLWRTAEQDALELIDLRRQLEEAQAQLAQRDAARTADAEDYPELDHD